MPDITAFLPPCPGVQAGLRSVDVLQSTVAGYQDEALKAAMPSQMLQAQSSSTLVHPRP